MTETQPANQLPPDPIIPSNFNPFQWQADYLKVLESLPDRMLAARLKAAGYDAMRHFVSGGNELETLTVQELHSTQWPEPVEVVKGMLQAGLAILHGKSKVGKSWLGLQLAFAVASGGKFLNVPVERGRVLYFALEDSPRRLDKRTRKQQWPSDLKVDFVLAREFGRKIGNLAREGCTRLAQQIEANGYRLVVIDTLGRSLGMYFKPRDLNDYGVMTQTLAPLQELALGQNCVLLFIDHQNKSSPFEPDAINDITGSMGKGATIDTAWGLYRERGKHNAELRIVGRDLDEERTLALDFDKEFCLWDCIGDADDLRMTEQRQLIVQVITDLKQVTLLELSGITNIEKGNLYKQCQELVNHGHIRQSGKNYLPV